MPRTLLEQQAELLKALGHPARLRIIQLLAESGRAVPPVPASETPEATAVVGAKDCGRSVALGEKCVCEIIPALGMEQSSVSKHLAVLRERGIVEVRREGTRMFYRLTDSRILNILQLAREICMVQLAQAQRMLTEAPPHVR